MPDKEKIKRFKKETFESEPVTMFEEHVDFITTGCTTLNLAASSKARNGGWARGRILNLVGDGSSGKTLVALEFAAVCYHKLKSIKSKLFPPVKKLKIIYDNVEGVMDFPVESMYGKEFYDAVEWEPRSEYIEDFGQRYLKELKNLKSGEALIYIIDSWDALDSKEEGEAFDKHIDKGTKLEGSFDLGKQKYASKRFFKKLCKEMKGKDCTLMIVSQTRVKIGVTFGKKKHRTGGAALDFYTHQVCWLYEAGKLKKISHGHEWAYGIRIKAKFERNKVAKPYRETVFDILFDYGIDDERSMVTWFFGPEKKEMEWDGKKHKREEFINLLEDNPDEREAMIDAVEAKWNKIEAAMPKKKKKYG